MPRVKLRGQVVSNDDATLYRWFGFSDLCCPADVQKAIDECPEGEDLVLEMNSGGGSVYAGFEMYTMLMGCNRHTVAEVQSLAGSAMSVIAAACDEVLMSPVSAAMIHLASVSVEGSMNAEDSRRKAQMLETIDESILNAYERKVKGKTGRTKLRHMMENETYLTAQEAIDCGLADGILGESAEGQQPIPEEWKGFVASVWNDTGAWGQLPPVDTLKEKMEAMNRVNSDPKAGETVQDNAEEEEREETMANETKEELLAAYPELIAQIQAEAQSAERERLIAIDGVALPGFEDIVAQAKADPNQNAGTVAMAIIKAQRQQGMNWQNQAREDAAASGANSVPAAEAPGAAGGHGETDDLMQAAKEAVADFERGGVR